VTPEGTEVVQSISFSEEGLSGNVEINEYSNPPQEIRSSVSQSVSAAGAVDRGDVSTINVVDITPDNNAAEDPAATVTLSAPADEVTNPEQLTVVKETYSFEQQEDTWTELDTTVEEEGDEEITVSAEAESFSLFAVAEVEQTDGDGTADDGAEDDDGAADDGATDDGLPGFGAVAALLALIGTMLYARRHA
jgi:PGF-CTERM protein